MEGVRAYMYLVGFSCVMRVGGESVRGNNGEFLIRVHECQKSMSLTRTLVEDDGVCGNG